MIKLEEMLKEKFIKKHYNTKKKNTNYIDGDYEDISEDNDKKI